MLTRFRRDRPSLAPNCDWREATWQFQRRAVFYAHWDACLGAKTRFFGAACVTNQVLAELVSASGGRYRVETCTPWLLRLGASLQRANSVIARAVARGDLAGRELDEDIVWIEQSHVERSLRDIRSTPAYPTLLRQLDRLLNEQSAYSSLHFKAGVRWYGRVLKRVQSELRSPIVFECQSHREAIGRALIRALRMEVASSPVSDKTTAAHALATDRPRGCDEARFDYGR